MHHQPGNRQEDHAMSIWILFPFAFVGASLWLWWKRTRRVPSPVPGAERAHPLQPYHCVSIKPHDEACAGARLIEGRRFLPYAAPLLPMNVCDSSSCRCRYAHYDDRRHDERRSWNAILHGFAAAPGDVERRSCADRRRSPEYDPCTLQVT